MTFFELVEILHVYTHELIGFFIQHPNPQKSPPSADPIHNTFFALSALFVIQFYNKKKNSHTPSFKSSTSSVLLLAGLSNKV